MVSTENRSTGKARAKGVTGDAIKGAEKAGDVASSIKLGEKGITLDLSFKALRNFLLAGTKILVRHISEPAAKAIGSFLLGVSATLGGFTITPLLAAQGGGEQIPAVSYVAAVYEFDAGVTKTVDLATSRHQVYEYQWAWTQQKDSITATVTELGNDRFGWAVDGKINNGLVAMRYRSFIENGRGIGTILLRQDEQSKLMVGWREGTECIDGCASIIVTRCPIVIGPVEQRNVILRHDHLHTRCRIVTV